MISHPVGIGGWLSLLGFGLCVDLLRGVFEFLNGMSDFSAGWSANPAARGSLALVFVLALVYLAANAWAIIALLGKKRSFRQAYLALWLLTLVVPLCTFVVLRVPGVTSEMIPRSTSLGGAIGAFVAMAFWFLYISLSARVRNILVN